MSSLHLFGTICVCCCYSLFVQEQF